MPGFPCALIGNREDAEPPCANGLDDDGDGLVDALDPECVLATSVEVGHEPDCNGLVDAADPDCAAPYDWSEAAACADRRDNDGDGLFDATDPGCSGPADDDER